MTPVAEVVASSRRWLALFTGVRVVFAAGLIAVGMHVPTAVATVALDVLAALVLIMSVVQVAVVARGQRAWLAAFATDPTRLVWVHAVSPLIDLHDRDDEVFYGRLGRMRHPAVVRALREAVPGLVVTESAAERAAHAPIAAYTAKLGIVERGFVHPEASRGVRELGAAYARWLAAWTARDHDEVARGEAVIALDQVLHYQRCDQLARGLTMFVDDAATAIAKLPRPDAPDSPFRT